LVLAGTSGAGKGTIGARLRESDPRLHWSVSWTTREPRAGEVEGLDYRFVTREEFERLRDAGGFLEWFEVYGDLKGTPVEYVRRELDAGHDVMLEIDVQGALAVKRALPEALLVFVQAPSREEQRRRLESRGSETPESIDRRLARAAAEERTGAAEFDAVVVNDDVGRAVGQVAAILSARREPEGT
jgi:guanylate kinase